MLTGYGAPEFSDIAMNIAYIGGLFRQYIGNQNIQGIEVLSIGGFPSVHVSQRYFKHLGKHTVSSPIPFSKEVDPDRTLQRYNCDKLGYTSDNVVDYYRKESVPDSPSM